MQDTQQTSRRPIAQWWVPGVRGLILVAAGVLALFYPTAALLGLAVYLGVALTVAGVLLLVQSIQQRPPMANWGLWLFAGLIEAVLGIILLANPLATAAAIPFTVGIWAIAAGIFYFAASFGLKSRNVASWWITMLGGVVGALAGWLVLANPFRGTLAISTLIGAALILTGVVSMLLSRYLAQIPAGRLLEFVPPEDRGERAA